MIVSPIEIYKLGSLSCEKEVVKLNDNINRKKEYFRYILFFIKKKELIS